MIRSARCLAPLCLLAALSACQKEEAPAPDPIRPVISIVAQPREQSERGFAGTIQPRVQTNFGFRVLGRVISRDVKVGDSVRRGQSLASIDPTTLDLARQAASANLASARAQLANAAGAEERQRALHETRTVTQATLDAAVQARAAANAAVTRAQAAFDKAQEQLTYANLTAEFDGIVTGASVDVGQVVSPGQTAVTIARPDQREAVVDIPQWVDGGLAVGAEFTIALELAPHVVMHGKVREIAPEADKITRTRRVRIALDAPDPVFRLGATILASPSHTAAALLDLPASAILEEAGRTRIFTVEGDVVKLQDVTVTAAENDAVSVLSGLRPGVRVVTAGVHSLKDGQKIRPLRAAGAEAAR